MPPFWLIRVAVAGVWLYEGLWCKLLRGDPNQLRVVEKVPFLGPRAGAVFLRGLGVLEVLLAAWAVSAVAPRSCALAQTVLLLAMNAGGILWSRPHLHDPGGMVVKNLSFLVLVWVAAGLPG